MSSSATREPQPAPEFRAVLAVRTTRTEGGSPLDDALVPHLRVILARVLRTGHGPPGLVDWVRGQLADRPPPPGADTADQLAGRLQNHLMPPTPSALETVTAKTG